MVLDKLNRDIIATFFYTMQLATLMKMGLVRAEFSLLALISCSLLY